MSIKEQYEILHAIDVCKSKLGYHTILTLCNEPTPEAAVGIVLVNPNPNPNPVYIGANFQLNAESGNLWVLDQGDVFTTAAVNFNKPALDLLKFNAGSFDIDWQVTEAFKGQLNGIWDTTDSDVWVTSFAGPVIHWNGSDWIEYNLPEAPNAIDGSASDNIYVVGYHGNIHHYDDHTWIKIALPSNIASTDTFTDEKVFSKDLVYITAQSGCLLVGNATDGFKDIGSGKYAWYGIGTIEKRIFLACGDAGIFELIDGQLICITEKGQPVVCKIRARCV